MDQSQHHADDHIRHHHAFRKKKSRLLLSRVDMLAPVDLVGVHDDIALRRLTENPA